MKLKINIHSLSSIGQAGHLKAFSAFLIMKSCFSNSCIYNYTQKGLAAKCGLTIGKVRKYVPFFIKMGWCRKHGKNLVFNKVKACHSVHKGLYIPFEVKRDIKAVFNDLTLLIFRHKQHGFERIRQIGRDIDNSQISEGERRRLNRVLDGLGLKTNNVPRGNDKMKLSIKSIADGIGVSVGSAHSLVTGWKRSGDVWCESDREVIAYCRNKRVAYMAAEECGGFVLNGYVIRVGCNRYDFL